MALWTLNLDDWTMRIILFVYFGLTAVFYSKGKNLAAGTMLLLGGILLALNGVSIVISLIIMGIGVITIASEKSGGKK